MSVIDGGVAPPFQGGERLTATAHRLARIFYLSKAISYKL
jgi:hypothetical protein